MSDVAEGLPALAAGSPAFFRRLLSEKLGTQGLFTFGFLPRWAFLDLLKVSGTKTETMDKYEVGTTESVIVAALRYGEGLFPPPAWAAQSGREPGLKGTDADKASRPALRIGRFARANWYMELSGRMKTAVAEAIGESKGRGIPLPPPKAWRRLVNSGLPEKPLAEKAGLGWMGKNGILIARRKTDSPGRGVLYSSAVVLGLILCPVDLGGEIAEPVKEGCGDCRLCVEACPTGALGGRLVRYDRDLCIQHWAALDGKPPGVVRAAWGSRLYGCDSCLEACPHFRTDPEAATEKGLLGPALPAEYFLSADDAAIRRDLSGTALDRAWMSIEAFRRNARAATRL